jgi:hypothetical protein
VQRDLSRARSIVAGNDQNYVDFSDLRRYSLTHYLSPVEMRNRNLIALLIFAVFIAVVLSVDLLVHLSTVERSNRFRAPAIVAGYLFRPASTSGLRQSWISDKNKRRHLHVVTGNLCLTQVPWGGNRVDINLLQRWLSQNTCLFSDRAPPTGASR